MSNSIFSDLIAGVSDGRIIPYIGAGGLNGAVDTTNGEPIPADSDSLILAMNGGKPMAPKLMYEFPRAAMNLELKRGRSFVTRFLTETYEKRQWTRAPLHEWLAGIKPAYVVDINRDTQLQDSYADTPHTLVVGLSRTGGTDFRFRLYQFDGEAYTEITQQQLDTSLPILFKPMGSPRPNPTYVASDADYVDYITELMGGFGIPAYLKQYREGKQYLFLGLRFTRDTERMVMSDIIYSADKPAGWALIPEPTDKERRFCKRQNILIVEADIDALLSAAGMDMRAA